MQGEPRAQKGSREAQQGGAGGEGLLGRRGDEAQSLQREKGGRDPGQRLGAHNMEGRMGAFYLLGPRSLHTALLCPLPPSCLLSPALLGRQDKLQT